MNEPATPERWHQETFKAAQQMALKVGRYVSNDGGSIWVDVAKVAAMLRPMLIQNSTLEAKVDELEQQRDASTPHRNRDYSTNPITDERLAQMCDETRWWKTDGDEIYRAVHELKDTRAKGAKQAATIERLTDELNVAKVRSESISFTYEVPSRWKKQKSAWESGYEAGWRGWILRNPYTSVHHQDAYANGYRVAEQSVALKSAALSKQEPTP